ncbi:MAG: ABC transporter transmembrane domain-containing protein [Planctomycetota bacterium]
MISSTDSRLTTDEIVLMLQRICEQLDVPFSSNRIFPSLADLNQNGFPSDELEQLNALGKQFGIRFRGMEGSLQDLIDTVGNSGPIAIKTNASFESQAILVLEARSRGKLLVHYDGGDRVVSSHWLYEQTINDQQRFNWLLIKPMLAAKSASRFHYVQGNPKEPLKPIQRFVELLRPEWQDVKTIIVFSIIIGLLSLTLPLAVEAVVNTIAFGRYLQPLIVLSLIVLVFLGFRAGLNVLMTVVVEIIQRKLFVRTVEDLSYRLTRVPLSTWNQYHGPELVNRFFDIVNIQKITSKLLLETLMLALQTVIGLSVLAFYHPFLLGYDIGLLTMMTVVLWLIGRGAIKTAQDESQLKYDTAAWLQEIVRHPSTFKFNGGLGYAINRADELAGQYVNHRQSHFKILIRQITFVMVMQVVAATALLALGGFLVIDGQMTLGQLVAAELIVTVILGSFAKIGKDLESFYDLMASVDKLGKLFDLPVESVDKLQLTKRPGPYSISLAGLQLDNESQPSENFDIEAGKTYAVHGTSELKRQKFVETLIGQTRPCGGHVLLNNFRVDSLSTESLQAKVSLVRDIELFESSIDENIRMGRENVGSERVTEIVSQLGLSHTFASLKHGLNSRIKICGFPLSQSEAIRMVLALSLIVKPGVLIIDGLLDRLSDRDTEDVLWRLAELKQETTIIISTGRGEIIDWADKKIDLDNSFICLS